MIIAVFDDMSLCTEAEVQKLLPLVSAQRRKQALRYKHVFGRYTCLKSWMMLQGLWVTGYGLRVMGDWIYNEYGKPYIEGGPEFSISHCQHGIAVAVDDKPIGIDIESIRPVKSELIERTMNQAEQDYIGQDPTRFTELWTRKEAYLKYKGTGIIDNLKHVLDDTKNVRFETTKTTNYVYTICHETNETD